MRVVLASKNRHKLEEISKITEKFGIELEKPEEIICGWFSQNNQCISERCPFHPVNHK